MEKMLTAKEFLEECSWEDEMHNGAYSGVTPEHIIEFAKLHVKAAKEEIKKELEKALYDTFNISLTDDFKLESTGRSVIDNAYPEENIK